MRIKLAFTLILGLLVLVSVARADIWSLTEGGCSGGCGPGPYGTVTVVQGVDASTVDITVALNSGNRFVDTGGPHVGFGWNIDGHPDITVGSLPSGWVVGPSPATNNTFGPFDYVLDCPGCGPGASNAKPGPLSFSVTSLGGLTPADFVANSDGYFFTTDIIVGYSTGPTGNVAAEGPPTIVPEPSSVLLLWTAAAGIIWRFKKRLRA